MKITSLCWLTTHFKVFSHWQKITVLFISFNIETPSTMVNSEGCKTDLYIFISWSPLLLSHFVYSLRYKHNSSQLWDQKATASSKTFFQNMEVTTWDWHAPTCCPVQLLSRPSAMASGVDNCLAWKMAISHILLSLPWNSFEYSMCINCVYDFMPARQSEQQGVR